MFTIYKITCTPTGKSYVGQTIYALDVRWNGHLTEAPTNRTRALAEAIDHYGVDAFVCEVVQEVRTQQQANEAEKRWIAKLNTRTPHGLNVRAGGGWRSRASRTKQSCKPTSITFECPADLNIIREAAHHAGKSVSRFLRDIGMKEATKILAARGVCAHCGAPRKACAA